MKKKCIKKIIINIVKICVYTIMAIEGCFGNFGTNKNKDPWEKWFRKK